MDINWLDEVIVLVFLIYVCAEFYRGFLRVIVELAGMILILAFAFKYFAKFASWLSPLAKYFNASNEFISWLPLICFLSIWFVLILVIDIVIKIIFSHIELTEKQIVINRYFGIIPAAAKGLMFLAIILSLATVLPAETDLGVAIEQSYLGSRLANFVLKAENKIQPIKNLNSSLPIAKKPGLHDDDIKLDFTTQNGQIDVKAESEILVLVNNERTKKGLSILKMDPLITQVARAHSRDMLAKGYFSHQDPDGKTPYDRLMAERVLFRESAENLALAQNSNLVHTGLMNSPRHRDNILNPNFSRVGIGVINSGEHGLMVTQNFVR